MMTWYEGIVNLIPPLLEELYIIYIFTGVFSLQNCKENLILVKNLTIKSLKKKRPWYVVSVVVMSWGSVHSVGHP